MPQAPQDVAYKHHTPRFEDSPIWQFQRNIKKQKTKEQNTPKISAILGIPAKRRNQKTKNTDFMIFKKARPQSKSFRILVLFVGSPLGEVKW